MILVHSCVWGKIPVHLPEEWRFRCIHVWGIRFRCIDLRDIDFSAFMCEGMDQSAFTWRVTISVHSCVRGTIPVHLLEEWWFRCIHVWSFRILVHLLEEWPCRCILLVHACDGGKISVHLLEGWWFRCIHVWGVRCQCIHLLDDDFGALMCEG